MNENTKFWIKEFLTGIAFALTFALWTVLLLLITMPAESHELTWTEPEGDPDGYLIYNLREGQWELISATTQLRAIVTEGCYRVSTVEGLGRTLESSNLTGHVCTEGACHND